MTAPTMSSSSASFAFRVISSSSNSSIVLVQRIGLDVVGIDRVLRDVGVELDVLLHERGLDLARGLLAGAVIGDAVVEEVGGADLGVAAERQRGDLRLLQAVLDLARDLVVLDHVDHGAADFVVLVLVPEIAREPVGLVGVPIIERGGGAVALAGDDVVAQIEGCELAVVVLGLEVVRAAIGVVVAAGDHQAEAFAGAEALAEREVAVEDAVLGEVVVAAGERWPTGASGRARAW